MQAAETYTDPSILGAWIRAASAVAANGSPPYVITVTSGTAWQPTPEDLHALDRSAVDAGAERPSTVAQMLMPAAAILSTGNAAAAIESGLRMLGRGRRKGLRYSTWSHTYFERIAGGFDDRQGNRVVLAKNRLLAVIDKLNEWGGNREAVFYIHTNQESDNFRSRGSPCLQYIQFRAHAGNIAIVGLYRAHDYTNKFLGNAIGLQSLGQFVARHTNRQYEGQTVISLNPFCDKKSQLKSFIHAVAP